MKARIFGLAAALAALLLNGCAGYRLGSMLPPDISTVYVPTFINKTKEPLIEIDTTQKAIQEITLDGSLKITTMDQADAILEVTLTDFSLTPVAYSTLITTQTREYRLWLTASIVLKRAANNTIIVERPNIRGQYVFPVIGDLTSSKLTAMPFAAQDLARNIISTCVEDWPPTPKPQPAAPAQMQPGIPAANPAARAPTRTGP